MVELVVTPALEAGAVMRVGSSPTLGTYTFLAQLVEQHLYMVKVIGSIPIECTYRGDLAG